MNSLFLGSLLSSCLSDVVSLRIIVLSRYCYLVAPLSPVSVCVPEKNKK